MTRTKSDSGKGSGGPSHWMHPDPAKLDLQFSIADSILKDFVVGHNPSAVLRELVQNEYDAQGVQVDVLFGANTLTVTGHGKPIDASGWKRLSVMLGTGHVGGTEGIIPQKVNGIGSKNFGLRSLFVYGDQIFIRSGGKQTVLDIFRGALPQPLLEPSFRHRRGIQIDVPYRTLMRGGLQPFDAAKEASAFDSYSCSLTPTLIKLARPQSPRSLKRLTISSERLGRRITWEQTAQRAGSERKGRSLVLRTVRVQETGRQSSSQRRLTTLKEMEFQKTLVVPERFHQQPIPGYFRAPGRRIRIALSFRLDRGKIDPTKPGIFFYPIGLEQGYTGCALSVCAPFELDPDRSHMLDAANSPWNDWLQESAANLTLDLLVSDWFERFGAHAYLALEETANPSVAGYLKRVHEGLRMRQCWPSNIRSSGSAGRPMFIQAPRLSVPQYPELAQFIDGENSLEPRLAHNRRIQDMAKEFGAETFGMNSLLRLHCGGIASPALQTTLDASEANHQSYTPEVLMDLETQETFAKVLEGLSRRLSSENRQDLQSSPTILTSDNSLGAPSRPLYVVAPEIAEVCPVPKSQQLHPALQKYKVISRLCEPFDVSKWAREVGERTRDGSATDEEQDALYRFILANHGHFAPKTHAVLRASPVLRDHRGEWHAPCAITVRKVPLAKRLEAVLHFPHRDYAKDSELARAFAFKRVIDAETVIAYAQKVEEHPELARGFAETLHQLKALVTPSVVKRLSHLKCLPTSHGGVERPGSLYLKTPLTLACLSDRAPFVVGSTVDLYKRLGCMEEPKADDILANIRELRKTHAEPDRPDILYPALVKALELERRAPRLFQSEAIIWTGKSYATPQEVLLSSRSKHIFLDAVPQLGTLPMVLRRAYGALGAQSEPQLSHWTQLFKWICQRYQADTQPLSPSESSSLLEAYIKLRTIPDGISSNTKCLLDRSGHLHSLEALRSHHYLLDDDPPMARAIEAMGKTAVLAEDRTIATRQFYQAIGVPKLSEVSTKIRTVMEDERTPPHWLNPTDFLKTLLSEAFLRAVYVLSQALLSEERQVSLAYSQLKSRLEAWQNIRFVRRLQVEYRVGTLCVLVPRKVIAETEDLICTWVHSRSEFLALLAEALADLLAESIVEQRSLTDAFFRILHCQSVREMMAYLESRGIAGMSLSSVGDADGEEILEPEEGQAVQESQDEVKNLLAEMLSKQLANSASSRGPATPSHTTQTFPQQPFVHKPSPSEVPHTLPPIKEVNLCVAARAESWKPIDHTGTKRSNGSNAGRPRSQTEEGQDREVGRRGEELIFRLERARVKALGYPESRVVWVSDQNQFADHDILSVGEDGKDVWLEVKATVGTHGRFTWSKGEFERALKERDRYILWRVYRADALDPIAIPFADPIGTLLNGNMQLDIADLHAEVEPCA